MTTRISAAATHCRHGHPMTAENRRAIHRQWGIEYACRACQRVARGKHAQKERDGLIEPRNVYEPDWSLYFEALEYDQWQRGPCEPPRAPGILARLQKRIRE